jgi:hypothetical protein
MFVHVGTGPHVAAAGAYASRWTRMCRPQSVARGCSRWTNLGASRRGGSAAEPGGGVSLLRRAHRAGNRGRSGGHPAAGPARLDQGAGLALPRDEPMSVRAPFQRFLEPRLDTAAQLRPSPARRGRTVAVVNQKDLLFERAQAQSGWSLEELRSCDTDFGQGSPPPIVGWSPPARRTILSAAKSRRSPAPRAAGPAPREDRSHVRYRSHL